MFVHVLTIQPLEAFKDPFRVLNRKKMWHNMKSVIRENAGKLLFFPLLEFAYNKKLQCMYRGEWEHKKRAKK